MSEALGPIHRLAVYGSLAPGKPNHHQLHGLAGRWLSGYVDGRLVDAGWGAGMGFPALVVDPGGERVGVDVFESPDLPEHWQRLDEFEGGQYRRAQVSVHTRDGDLEAFIYVLNPADGDPRG